MKRDIVYFKKKYANVKRVIDWFSHTSIKPDEINSFLKNRKTSEIKQKVRIKDLILRPQVLIHEFLDANKILKDKLSESVDISNEILEAAEIEIKYSGYIEREKQIAEKIKRLEKIKIHPDFDYQRINNLSTEARQKLSRIKPSTIGQASRISGVSPSDVNVLLVFLGR